MKLGRLCRCCSIDYEDFMHEFLFLSNKNNMTFVLDTFRNITKGWETEGEVYTGVFPKWI